MAKLGNCDVCNERPAIGVASTSMPMSVAFCQECAAQGADPAIVFVCMFDDCGIDFDKMADGVPDGMTTWKDGRFVTYREWATERAATPPPPPAGA